MQDPTLLDVNVFGADLARRFRPRPADVTDLTTYVEQLGVAPARAKILAERLLYSLLGRPLSGFFQYLAEGAKGALATVARIELPSSPADLMRQSQSLAAHRSAGPQLTTYLLGQARRYARCDGDPPHVEVVNEMADDQSSALIRVIERDARFAARRLRLPESESDDCVSDTILNVLKWLPFFRGENQLTNAIFLIAQRTCVEVNRKFRGRPSAALDGEAVERLASLTASDDYDGDVEQQRRVVAQHLAVLSEIENKVFRARYADELRTIEIARRFGVNHNTVRAHLLHAREKLRGPVAGDRAVAIER